MEVQRKEFLKILESLKLGIGSGSDIGLEAIAFTGDNLVSFNKIVSVSFPFKSNFSCLISYDKLSAVIKELNDERITLGFDSSQLRLESSNGKAGINKIEDQQVWDIIKEINPSIIKKWMKIPETFLTGLKLCLFSVMKEFTLGPLSCIYINGLDLYSSDNLRISHFILDSKMGKFLIPGDAISDLIRFPIIDFSVNNSWIYFRTKEKTIFSFRLIEGNFPDCKDFFLINKGTQVNLPVELKDILSSLVIFKESGETDLEMKASFQFKSGILICRSESSSGWIERRLEKIKYKGKDFLFFINPLFLKQIMEFSSNMIIDENERRALFTSKNFQHLISLPIK